MAKPRIAQAYRLVLLIIIVQVLMVGHAYSQSEHVGSVVDNFLIPITVPSGLCSDGSSLWIGDYAITSGSSSIYKIDIWTHQIVDSIPSPGAWDAGLARTDSAIWEFTDYPTFEDFALAKLSTSGKILRYFPARNSCYWSGIAWDGKDLYYGTNVCFASPKGQKSMIYKVNPQTGAVIDSIPPPSGHINGLVYNKGDLWYCDDNNGYIFEIDTTGQIIREFPLDLQFHGPLSGLTIARGYLWAVDMAGVNGPRIYGIDIGIAPAIPQGLEAYDGKDIPLKTRLTWKPSASHDVEWYRIYRGPMSQYGSGILTQAVVIDSVPGNVTTYTDTSATVGLTFAYWVSAVDSNGVESFVSNEADGYAWSSYDFKLGQNYPNPFNPTTTIPYVVASGDAPHVNIAIFDVLGRKVETLVNRNELPGNKTVVFNGSDLPSGVYFYRMLAGSHIETKKCMLIK